MPISERVATCVGDSREGASCLFGERSEFIAVLVCAWSTEPSAGWLT
jgi:hypothetical protein